MTAREPSTAIGTTPHAISARPVGQLTPERWRELESALDALLGLEESLLNDRLQAVRARDPALHAQLSPLLQEVAQAEAEQFLERPAIKFLLDASQGELPQLQNVGAAAAVPESLHQTAQTAHTAQTTPTASSANSSADGRASAPGPTDGLSAGQRIGSYRLSALLGRGGMGSVWLAQRADGRYDGQVAIKFLHGGLFGRGAAQRFAREGQILARLDHPHIARLLDAGLTPGDARPYIVLEYVQGVPIDMHVQAQGLDARATVALFMDVLAAVAHAHARLTLHRDLKPSNILVTPQGQVKLLDFGIAKLVSNALATEPHDQLMPLTEPTQQADRAYTLRYAAPEQVQGGDATTATDVYALGVLLHVLLTGGLHPTARTQVEGAGAGDARLADLNALVESTPRRASDAVARQGGARAHKRARDLRGDLDTIIGCALEKQPAKRYRNAADLADDLRRYWNHEPIAARPDGRAYQLAKFLQRHRWGVAAVGSVMLALGVGTALALQSAQEAQAQRRAAQEQGARAERLIEFMLQDLRPRLESANQLDLMEGVGVKLLAYYKHQDASNTDPAALSRSVQALTLVGRIAQLRGQLGQADSILSQALAGQAELTRRAPDNAEVLFSHADILAAAGQVHRLQGDLVKAESEYRESLSLNLRAQALQPDAMALNRVVASQSNLANFHQITGQTAAALSLFQDGQAGALSLAQTMPSAWLKVAGMRNGIADVQYQLGRLSESAATAHWLLQALDQVPNSDRNDDARSLRAGAIFRLGGLQLATGQVARAVSALGQAVAIEADGNLRAADNFQALSVLVQYRCLLTEALTWAGRRAQAQIQFQLAQADLARLLQRPDAPLEWRQRWRGSVLLQRAMLAPEDPQLTAELQAFVDEFARPQPQGVTLTASQWRTLAMVSLRLGDARAARQQPALARVAWRNALAALHSSKQPGFPYAMSTAVELHWRLGNTAQALALAAEIDKGEFRHPAYMALRRQMQRAPITAAIR